MTRTKTKKVEMPGLTNPTSLHNQTTTWRANNKDTLREERRVARSIHVYMKSFPHSKASGGLTDELMQNEYNQSINPFYRRCDCPSLASIVV
jgi:hypothetical protein